MNTKIIPQMKYKLEKQLEYIEEIAEKKNEEIENYYYNKYYYLFELLINFLKKRDILMYGGSAINEVLKKKIYKKYELPDIDIYCYESSNFIKDIIQYYKSNDIIIISAKEALHENTFKLYTEGIQILDITNVSKDDFANLKKNSIQTSLGIRSVSINLLKYSIHALSSQSYDAFRWSKVYPRMLQIYEEYPLDLPCKLKLNDYYVNIPKEIDEKIQYFIKKENVPSFGWDTVSTYLKDDPLYRKISVNIDGLPIRYVIYDGDIKLIAKLLLNECDDINLKIVETYKGDLHLPSYVTIGYKEEKCLYIFNTNVCLSVVDVNANKLLSIHSIITLFYAMYFSSNSNDLLCVIQMLTGQLFKNLLSRKKLFNNFSLVCYGKQTGIVTLRRERDLRKKNKNLFKK